MRARPPGIPAIADRKRNAARRDRETPNTAAATGLSGWYDQSGIGAWSHDPSMPSGAGPRTVRPRSSAGHHPSRRRTATISINAHTFDSLAGSAWPIVAASLTNLAAPPGSSAIMAPATTASARALHDSSAIV